MQSTYNQIVQLINQKPQLGMNSNNVTYNEVPDAPYEENGELVTGTTMTIDIPSAWMKQAGATNAQDFHHWLQNQ